MDPALLELYAEGTPDDEVAVILRLGDPAVVPDGVRIVVRFGPIATCRLRRGDIPEIRRREPVRSMKAAKLYGSTPVSAELTGSPALEGPEEGAGEPVPEPGDQRRPEGSLPTGRGVVVAHIDWGVDFAHPDFRKPDGRTRLLALWDQSSPYDPGRPNRYGYGRIYYAEEIDRALAAPDPYAALGYDHTVSDSGPGTHGTHTLSIAAGNGGGGGPVGLAPEADLAFVHLSTYSAEGPTGLGDSVALLEGLDFIAQVAGSSPFVVNMSLGRQAGEHDGRTLTEQGMDAFLLEAPGRALCQSTGNYFNRQIHAYGVLRPGESRTLRVIVDAADRTPNEVDLWYPGVDRFRIVLRGPDGTPEARAGPGERVQVTVEGREVGRLYHRLNDPNNCDNEVTVFLYRAAPAGEWELTLLGEAVADGRFHAWIERDASRPRDQARFVPEDSEPTSTTGTICNGLWTLAVGAYDAHREDRPLAPFSSCGPTRDGRPQKPNLVAPGVRVLAARSRPRLAGPDPPLLARMSGTSMAAPCVTGTVALMFEAAGRPLSIEETRRLLLANTDPPPEDAGPTDRLRLGSGYLNTTAAMAATQRLGARTAASTTAASGERLADSDEKNQSERYGPMNVSSKETAGPETAESGETAREFMAGPATSEATAERSDETAGEDSADSEDYGPEAVREHRKDREGRFALSPFQVQVPLTGGPPALAVPVGGPRSPLAFTVPFGGPSPAAAPTPAPAQTGGPPSPVPPPAPPGGSAPPAQAGSPTEPPPAGVAPAPPPAAEPPITEPAVTQPLVTEPPVTVAAPDFPLYVPPTPGEREAMEEDYREAVKEYSKDRDGLVRDRRQGRFGPPSPKIQVPLAGGPPALAVPVGGRRSPLAVTVPFGGAPAAPTPAPAPTPAQPGGAAFPMQPPAPPGAPTPPAQPGAPTAPPPAGAAPAPPPTAEPPVTEPPITEPAVTPPLPVEPPVTVAAPDFPLYVPPAPGEREAMASDEHGAEAQRDTLPFQVQVPLTGGGPALALPLGGPQSPLAFTVPLGGTPSAPATPVIPQTGGPTPAFAAEPFPSEPPVTVAAPDFPIYAPPIEEYVDAEALEQPGTWQDQAVPEWSPAEQGAPAATPLEGDVGAEAMEQPGTWHDLAVEEEASAGWGAPAAASLEGEVEAETLEQPESWQEQEGTPAGWVAPVTTPFQEDFEAEYEPGQSPVESEAESDFGERVLAAAEAAAESDDRLPLSTAALLALLLAPGPRADSEAEGAAVPLSPQGTGGPLPSATALFNAFVYPNAPRFPRNALHRHYARHFQVLAHPGEPLSDLEPRWGDLLLRVVRGAGWGHVSVVAAPELHRYDRLGAVGLRGEGYPRLRPGLYVQVVEISPRRRRRLDRFARRLCDGSGLVLPDTLLLRPLFPGRYYREAEAEAGYVDTEFAELAGCPLAEDVGFAEQPAPPPAAAAPDSALANRFIAAHPSRYCTPGQAGSATCQTLAAPRPIRRVVIHVVAVPSTARRSGVEAVVAGWQNAGRQASSHYLVDRDGTITQMVREADVAFHTPGNNRDSIGIEHADVCNDPAPLTTKLYERSAALVRDLASRHGFAINNNTVAGHSQVNPNHGDPGPYWDWEYYFLLLAWAGTSAASRPIRLVTSAAGRAAVPGWQVQHRRAIPNDHCASRRDPWGATYWRAQPSATGTAAELSVVADEAGTYKVSLWWPDVSGANPAVPVEVEVACLMSPCTGTSTQTVTVNQRPNAGRWNDIASVTVTQAPSEVKVRLRRDSAQPGWILADGLRVLKIATSAAGAGQAGGEYLEASPPVTLPPARTTTVARAGFRPDVSVLCPPPPLILDKFDFDGDRPKAAHRTRLGTLAQEIVDSQTGSDPIHTLCILGHTDSVGGETYNQDLAARRAIAVANELETALEARQPGLAATLGRTVESRGEEAPLVPNDSAANRARNRRVEIFLNRRWVRSTPAVGACPAVAVAADDPTAPTAFAVGEDTFSATISLFGTSLPVSGTVFYPADSAGSGTAFASTLTTPAPLVVFAHGNHSTFRHPTDRFRENCGPGSGFVPLANHRGYDYLQRLLAGMGMVAVSVDANVTNCTGLSPTNIHLRGALILAAIQHFLNLNTGGGSRFAGRLDLARTALLGHSRGGEAVLVAAETLPTVASLSSAARVLGVLSLAPTDAGATSGRPSGFAYMAMLPAADGDVIDNDGAKFYDQAAPSPFKCQIYVHGANHNFFNRNWPLDEGHGAARLSRAEHERILSVYACAFFRGLLLGHNTLRFLRVDVLPPGVPADKVQVSFEATGTTTVDDHENRNISLNALGAPTTQSAGLTAAEFDFQQGVLSSFNNSFFGKTVGMVAQTSAAGGLFRSQLSGDTNLTGRELWVRVAEVYNGAAVPTLGTGYQIGVEDAAGNTSFADSNDVGGLPRPFDRRADDVARLSGLFGARADRTKTMLKTQRFAAACFARPGFDLTRVRAVLLRLDRGDNRALAFDQLQIV